MASIIILYLILWMILSRDFSHFFVYIIVLLCIIQQFSPSSVLNKIICLVSICASHQADFSCMLAQSGLTTLAGSKHRKGDELSCNRFSCLWESFFFVVMGVSGWMCLLVPAHPGSHGQRAVKWLHAFLCIVHCIPLFTFAALYSLTAFNITLSFICIWCRS